MGRFKIGDKVRVREWDDMAKERGSNKEVIFCTCSFVDCMKPLCGKVFTVIGTNGTFFYGLDGEASGWAFSDDMLYPAITYREYMKENFPDDVSKGFRGGVYGCPGDKGFRDYYASPVCANGHERCAECWDEYMTEAEYKKYVLKEEEEKEMFKVGDIVRVAKKGSSATVTWVPLMDKYIGKYGVVESKRLNSCEIKGFGGWNFPYENLEPATPKDILVPLCVVKTRSGDVGLFVGNNRVLLNSTFIDISTHSNTLESSYVDDFDIMEIYEPATYAHNIHELISERGKRIWKREEVVEITAEEAAKKLSEQHPGQTVKIIV